MTVYELSSEQMLRLLRATKENGEKDIAETGFDMSEFAEKIFLELVPRAAYNAFLFTTSMTRRKGWTTRRPTYECVAYQGEALTPAGELILAALEAKHR